MSHRPSVLVALLVASAALASLAGAATTHYEISLQVNWEEKSFSGVEEIGWTNPEEAAFEDVVLRLYPNAFALYGEGTLAVTSVLVDGVPAEAEFSSDKTVLRVRLQSPLQRDSAVSLSLSFNGRPAIWNEDGPSVGEVGYGTFAASTRALTLASFFPILAVEMDGRWDVGPVGTIGDPVTSESASYDVSVAADCPLSVLTSGTLETQDTVADLCTSHFTGDGMRDFMIVVGSAYQEELQTQSGVLLRGSFFAEHETARRIALARASAALSIYAEYFGSYAYDELDLVEVLLDHAAGVEYPGLVLVGASYCDRPEDPFFDVVVAHEVAHQWWYAAVGNDVANEPWLDEGLATFSSELFFERIFGQNAAQGLVATWESTYQQAHKSHPELSVISPAAAFEDSATYSAFVYSGGALFFDALRRIMGDTLFFEVLRTYYSEQTLKIARGSDLLRRFEEASPRDLSGLFAEYLGRQGASALRRSAR
jgi:hypothetical protein